MTSSEKMDRPDSSEPEKSSDAIVDSQDNLPTDLAAEAGLAPWRVNPHTDPAYLLAWRLEQAGVDLNCSWRDCQIPYTVRVYNVLTKSGYETLAEVILALRDDGGELRGQWGFGRLSLTHLRLALEDFLAQAAAGNPEMLFVSPPPWVQSVASPPRLITRLEASGVDLDQHWQKELVQISSRVRNFLRERFDSLREVVIATTEHQNEMLAEKNMGRKSLRELEEAIEALARHGPGYHKYGEGGGPPTSVDELVTRGLEALSHDLGRLLVRRYLDGETLEGLGNEYDLTRERIRQKLIKSLIRIRLRFGDCGQALMSPLIVASNDAGGLMHRDTAVALTGTDDLRRIRLALAIAGEDSFRILREEFLTSLSGAELTERWRTIRNGFWNVRRRDLRIDEAKTIITRSSGLLLDEKAASRLLTLQFGYQVKDDGTVIPSGRTVPDRLERILREAGRAMRISEIAERFLADSASTAGEALADEEEDEESEVSGRTICRQERIERVLLGAISRHPDIYQYGPLTFLQAEALPVSQDQLDQIVEFCVDRIKGQTGAISAASLMKSLEDAGMNAEGMNVYLLKSVLSRHPEVISVGRMRVGHVASFQEHGLTLEDRLDQILSAADAPLSPEDVLRLIPRTNEYFPGSIALCLGKCHFAVNLGGRYVHLDRLGLNEAQRKVLLEKACALLPEDGTPLSCLTILQQLRPILPELGLANRDDAADILRGLLRLEDRIQVGAGRLVARRIEAKEQSLLEGAIIQIIREAVLAYPRDVRRELTNTYGERQRDSNLSSYMLAALRRGLLRRLPGSLYFAADEDEARVIEELASYESVLRRSLTDTELEEVRSADLLLLARYFYRQDDLAAARRLLAAAQERVDLTDDQRRSCQRLMMVILSKL
jgi:hypothetical protein